LNAPQWVLDVVAEWTPHERIGGNEWAERHRVLGKNESASPGPWRSVPWQREILDALADDTLTRVTILKGAQFGVSDLVRNAIGRWAMVDPGDVLWVMADEIAAKKAMRSLKRMFENSPDLRPLMVAGRSEVTGEKARSSLLEFRLTNMRVVIGWAGSAASLASEPFRRVILDEVAKYKWHVQGEGSPVGLAEERTKSFGRRGKMVLLSTPKHEGDQIVKAHRETLDRRVFAVPCPDCGHMQVPELESVRWPGGGVPTAPTEPEARVRLAAEVRRDQSAWLQCARCPGHVSPHLAMHAPAARWIREEEVNPDDRRAYHIAEFVHWQTTVSDLAAKWLRCTHPKELSEFWNGSLGLPYRASAASLQAGVFEARARHPNGVVPSWATAVLATADTQADHFWFMVRAWGAGGRSRLLDWGKAPTFDELRARCLDQRFAVEGGGSAVARFLLIDSGGGMETPDGSRTHEVYQFARRTAHVIPIKGESGKNVHEGRPIRTSRVTYRPAEGDAYEVDLHLLHVDYWKDTAAALIRSEAPVLWEECQSAADPTYGRHLAGEVKVMLTKTNGETSWQWQPRSKHARHDLWDCAVYQCAAAEIARADAEAPVASRLAAKTKVPTKPEAARARFGAPPIRTQY
jgi:phage terminase large subunit GpA-like protein